MGGIHQVGQVELLLLEDLVELRALDHVEGSDGVELRRQGFRDGRPEPYHFERYSDFLRIYAGDEDVFLDVGSYTYVLTYETDRQIRWFDDKPEIFWNVTGNDWIFPILK